MELPITVTGAEVGGIGTSSKIGIARIKCSTNGRTSDNGVGIVCQDEISECITLIVGNTNPPTGLLGTVEANE